MKKRSHIFRYLVLGQFTDSYQEAISLSEGKYHITCGKLIYSTNNKL